MALDDGIKLLGGILGVLAGVPALGISLYNLNNYEADRRAKSSQTAFDNQMSLAKLYMERTSGQYCEKKNEAQLLVRVTGYSAQQLKTGLDESSSAIGALAAMLREDLERHNCPDDSGATAKTEERNGIASAVLRQADST
jgi:mevalonate pyrophosphate decarboxylase